MISTDLLDLVVTAIGTSTDAGARVYSPGDWPAMDENLPLLKVRLLSEKRQSMARSGAPQFTTTATIRIIGEVDAYAAEDNAGASVAQAAAWQLKRQVEVAVINSSPLFAQIQQIAAMRSDAAFSAEGDKHIAGIQIDLDLEFYEGPEEFAPIAADDLNEAALTADHYPPVAALIPLTS